MLKEVEEILAVQERQLNKLYNEIGEKITDSISKNFEKEETPDGKKWESLKPTSYRKRKNPASRSVGMPKLQDTGMLKNSMKKHNIKNISENKVFIYVESDVPYAKFQNTTKFKGFRKPALKRPRTFAAIGKELEKEILDLVFEYIKPTSYSRRE
jgi:phage virion morphogenesis protein